jgi:uracil-DNA glycosylase family 4
VRSPTERREALKRIYLEEAKDCRRCPLHQTRTNVVFGAGDADADLVFIGEAPGRTEDEQGLPFVGQAGKLLDKLLGEIGLARNEVFVANVLKCLRYTAMVQLSDGSWERIGRLVRSRYSGEVMSVDADGHLVPRRVIGWHATPLGGRKVFHLTYRNAKRAGAGRVGVELTGDHPVLTERGYVPVQDLTVEDRVATGHGLSALARDVICGTVLGDGTLQAASSYLSFSHSQRQGEYARFKADLLAELEPRIDERTVAAVVGGRSYPVIHVRTLAHRALRVMRDDFYDPEKRKVVPDWLGTLLNPRMLAFWFMDDGYMRIRETRRPRAEIATLGFDDDSLDILLWGLQELGLPAKALRGRIFFDVPTSERLSEMIAPFVLPSMRYKLHPDVAARIPFDPRELEPGPKEACFDDVEVKDITHVKRNDTTFFCIDVQDTHNFVTAGGVVHNCRPPNNRDPQPIEIESCRDYLERQVELIEPRVICTLGNFSTKLLRADTTGISRVHGQEEERLIGNRAVRLYPLYHPAAALYTPSTLETLRADFHRIPELLALAVPDQPEPLPELPEVEEEPEPEPVAAGAGAADPAEQLGLF